MKKVQEELIKRIMDGLISKGKFVIYGLGTIRLVPSKRGKYWNIHTGMMEEKGEGSMRLVMRWSPLVKEWLKGLDTTPEN